MEHSTEDQNRPSERLARLETQIEFMQGNIIALKIQSDEMLGIIQQLKGAKWSLLAVATLLGFLINFGLTFIGKHS